MQNLQEIGNFFINFHSLPLQPKYFCMGATGTPRHECGVPWDYIIAWNHAINYRRNKMLKLLFIMSCDFPFWLGDGTAVWRMYGDQVPVNLRATLTQIYGQHVDLRIARKSRPPHPTSPPLSGKYLIDLGRPIPLLVMVRFPSFHPIWIWIWNSSQQNLYIEYGADEGVARRGAGV